MKARVLALVVGAALSQSPFAQESDYWKNVDNGFEKMIYAQESAVDAYWERVQAGFINMLEHEPYGGPTEVRVVRGIKDPVEQALHAPGGGDYTGQPRDDYFDNVDASFERALSHEPYAGPTGVTVARTPDYLVDRLVFELRQDRKQTAEVAAAQGYRVVK